MIKVQIQDEQETAEFNVIAQPLITRPLIAETDVQTIDNNISTYITGTNKRQLEISLGYTDAELYKTLQGFRDRQYAVLKYPTVTITTDTPIDIGYGEDIPDSRMRTVTLGKNMLNVQGGYTAGYINAQGTVTSATGNYALFNSISVKPNTTYTVSVGLQDDYQFNFAFFTSAGAIISRDTSTTSSTSRSATTPANCASMRIWIIRSQNWNQSAIVNANIMVEKGSNATQYAPYFTPIELCKIGTYQDYIYKSNGKWYVRKEIGKYVLTGANNENWYISTDALKSNTLSTTLGYPEMSSGYRYTDRESVGLYCNLGSEEKARVIVQHGESVGKVGLAVIDTGGGNSAIYVSKADYTVATWKAFLATTPLICYYVLATPTTTEITNSYLVAQLDALASSAFDGWTKIETQVSEGNLQPDLTVSQGEITASGKSVMLDGTTEDLLNFVIYGDTVQDGTPTPTNPVDIQTVTGDINFVLSGPSGRKKYTIRGKMALSEQRIVDMCGTHEQVAISIRESEQL